MKDYVTIQDAIRATGTSDSTIRRWLKSLDTQTYKVNVKQDGRRLLIKRSFLIQSFKAVSLEEAGLASGVPARQQADLQKLLSRQADQIDQLINENGRKDDELKTAWNMILNLEREAARLSAEVKRLTAPAEAGERSDTIQNVALIALALAALASFIYLVANN